MGIEQTHQRVRYQCWLENVRHQSDQRIGSEEAKLPWLKLDSDLADPPVTEGDVHDRLLARVRSSNPSGLPI